MTNSKEKIFKSVILSWIVLFGLISNHPDCQTFISNICHQKNVSFSIQQLSLFPADILALKSMSECSEGTCCEEQECSVEKNILISGQYPDKVKLVLGSENKKFSTNDKAEKRFDGSCQNKIPRTQPIYIFNQSFLC